DSMQKRWAQKLLTVPLFEVQTSLPVDFIVVIDALDEREVESSVNEILELLLSTPGTLPIRFLMSSRPGKEITRRMTGRLDGQDEARLVLHNLDSDTVKADIEAYMHNELRDFPLTDAQWPLENAYDTKTLNRAVRVIMNAASTPMEPGDEKVIDTLYETILDTAFNKSGLNQENMRITKSLLDTDAEKWCTEHKVPENLIALAHDASQFVSIYANHPVSQSTPHIYVSMLPFWPRSRPISTAYTSSTSGLVRPTGSGIDRRQLALIATWKLSTKQVESMGLTAGGRRLVVARENSIEVCDTTTGESVLSLTDECTKNVKYVAVFPDGTHVAFSRGNEIAYVWEMMDQGTVTQLLPDDISRV
ncbi:unnamed protein product, partial [Rhizoctonia solani]